MTLSLEQAIAMLGIIEQFTEDCGIDGSVHQDEDVYMAFRTIRDDLITRSAVRVV